MCVCVVASVCIVCGVREVCECSLSKGLQTQNVKLPLGRNKGR